MGLDAVKKCPEWLDELIEDLHAGLDSGVAPYAFDVWGPNGAEEDESVDDPWLIHFYPALSEVKGGANDGGVGYPGISVDLVAIQESFEDIDYCEWSTGTRYSEPRYRAAVLDLMGWYDSHPVHVRIFEKPPTDATIDSFVDHTKVTLCHEPADEN